jgi:hypothetical protein
MLKKLISSILLAGCLLVPKFINAAVGTGPGGSFINNQNTLQSNATFYVSSGTVRNLNTNSLKFSDGTTQVTAAVSGGGSSTLQVMVNGVQISSPTSSLRFDNNFIGSNPSVGISSVSLSPNSTFYIQNKSGLQSPGVFNVSSATVSGQFLVSTSRYNLFFNSSSTEAFKIVNKSSESAYVTFFGSNTERWRFGADPKVLNNMDFGLYNKGTGVYTISISTNDDVTFNSDVIITGLTASMPVKTNSSKQLVSSLISLTGDVTGTLPSANLPSNVSYTNVSQTISGSKIFSSSQVFQSAVQISTTIIGLNRIQWADGTVQVSSGSGGGGGGSGTPGGSDTQLQYNNAGSFGGISTMTYSVGSNTLTIGATTIFSSVSTTTFQGVSTMTFGNGSALVMSTSTNFQVPSGQILTNSSSITVQGVLTAGSNITLTPTSGILTIASSGGSGSSIYNATSTVGMPFGHSASTGVYSSTLRATGLITGTGGFSTDSDGYVATSGTNLNTLSDRNLSVISAAADVGQIQLLNNEDRGTVAPRYTAVTFRHASINDGSASSGDAYAGVKTSSISVTKSYFVIGKGNSNLSTSNTDYLTINISTSGVNNGYVGIGVSDPQVALSVGGQGEIATVNQNVSMKMVGVIFSSTGAWVHQNTIAQSTVTVSTISGIGTLTIPANFLRQGHQIRLHVRGGVSAAGTQSLRLVLKIGTNTVVDSGVTSMSTGGLTNKAFEFDSYTNILSTAVGGSSWTQGNWRQEGIPATGIGIVEQIAANTAAVNIDTSVSNDINLSFLWGAANAANILRITNYTVEIF